MVMRKKIGNTFLEFPEIEWRQHASIDVGQKFTIDGTVSFHRRISSILATVFMSKARREFKLLVEISPK